MNNFALFFLLANFFLPLLQGDPPQEIRVHLATESPLTPIYLSKIELLDSSFPSNYVKELEQILEKDFNHNGHSRVLLKNEEKEQQLKKNPSSMGSLTVSFSIQGKSLQGKAFLPGTSQAKTFSSIPLTGTLSQDRRQLHKLSDTLHQLFFQSQGIANTRILYAAQKKGAQDSSWISEIVECDWDGENVKPITKENSYSVTPVLIPKDAHFQKDLFLYVSYKIGQPKIFISSLEEGKGKRVVDIGGNQLLPAISKQRDQLAFICDASGRTDLFIQPIKPETGLTGTPMQLFSYPSSTQASPTFNPSGSEIAFVSDKDGPARIYLISSAPTRKRPTARLITKKNRENSCPSWSPDGTKLAYSAKTDGVRQIWIYDFSTGEEKQLTSGPGHKENPCWAPNSLHIAFNSTDGSYSDLYIVNLNQPDVIKITKGQGKNHYPSWGLR